MAWWPPGHEQPSEPMMVSLLTHVFVTRPQWVKASYIDANLLTTDVIILVEQIRPRREGCQEAIGTPMTVELTDTNGHKDDLAAVCESYGYHTSNGILTKMGMPPRRLPGHQRGIQWLSGWQPVMPPPRTRQSPWQPQLSSVTIQVQWHLPDDTLWW